MVGVVGSAFRADEMEKCAVDVLDFRGLCSFVEVIHVLGTDTDLGIMFPAGEGLVGAVGLDVSDKRVSPQVPGPHHLVILCPRLRGGKGLGVKLFPEATLGGSISGNP